MEIEQHIWGFTAEGEAVVVYRMTNSLGASVTLTNIGAAITGINVPGRAGDLRNVVLGYADWRDYFNDGAAMGKTVGRYANRMGGARFTLDGVEYRLPRNVAPNHLHGGPDNLANKLWTGRVETDRVVFSLTSPDGDQGYPGELGVEVVYDWDDACNLEITFFARADKTTVINLTNHAYFNLSGEDAGSILDHRLKLHASRWLPTDTGHIPTGQMAPVEGTPMDFRTEKALGRDIEADFFALVNGGGYDSCWMVDDWSGEGALDTRIRPVAVLSDPASGRKLTIRSTQPAVQVYTGNFLAGGPRSTSGHDYIDRGGVAIECQGCPDAPNKPEFPSQRLEAGEVYNEKIVYSFGVV